VNSNILNSNTSANINTLIHVPGAAPVTNIDTPEDPSTFSHANNDTPEDANNPSVNQKAKKSRKRKSDEVDLVLPDGSRRVRKKKGRPDENIPVSSKRAKKKGSSR
jgi:hypothetical protein